MSTHCCPPALGPQAEGPRARYPPGAAARSFGNLPTGPLPPDPVAGTSVGRGRSSAPSHLDPLGRSDPTTLELDPALNSAVLTADAAKLAASADYSHCHQAQRVMPADPHHSGAAIVLSNTVGEAIGQEGRPFTAANVDPCYGHESKTMTLYREYLTPAEANPPSASEHRVPTRTFGLTSMWTCPDQQAQPQIPWLIKPYWPCFNNIPQKLKPPSPGSQISVPNYSPRSNPPTWS
jgi:hypothetical protein